MVMDQFQSLKQPHGASFDGVKLDKTKAEPLRTRLELSDAEVARLFRDLWRVTTDDNRLTLFGFRRFRTAHLLNLRFLEAEIDQIDHIIYQAGLKLDVPLAKEDRLGLRHGKKDVNALGAEETIDRESVLHLRHLLKEYDDGLTSFNQLMLMETFSLADNSWQSSLRSDLNPYEKYKTRLVRVDLAHRNGTRDLLRHSLRRFLRAMWFFVRSPKIMVDDPEHASSSSSAVLESRLKSSYQNTTRIAEVVTRLFVALLAAAFLVVPLVILSHQHTGEAQLATVCCCILVFSLLVSLLSQASNQETMAASAGYAAVLSVFVASGASSFSPTA